MSETPAVDVAERTSAEGGVVVAMIVFPAHRRLIRLLIHLVFLHLQ